MRPSSREIHQHGSGEPQVERAGGQAGGELATALVQDENEKFLGEPQHRVLTAIFFPGLHRTPAVGGAARRDPASLSLS